MEDFIQDNKPKNKLDISHVVDVDERLLKAKEIKKKHLNVLQFLIKKFGNKRYFKNIFPLIKEQKPGLDLYPHITFW